MIAETERAEQDLVAHAPDASAYGRKASGSFYTPADVADHVWDQFFRLHGIESADQLSSLIERTRFVEPSAGAGVFVFTLLRKALALGVHPSTLERLSMSVIDLNLAALRFVNARIAEVEAVLGRDLGGIVLVQRDFLDWAASTSFDRVCFIGNPPFVSNRRGARWRNLFASFLEAMLDYPARDKAIGLILPLSICFSRDYKALREKLGSCGLGIQASSYDNIPDCLFEAGKPESGNSNKANSQRCTILMLGGNPTLRQSASLRRWPRADRTSVLSATPDYRDFTSYVHDDQIPRPSCDGLLEYLAPAEGSQPLGTLLSRAGKPRFAVGSVARNFIGIREAVVPCSSSMAIAPGDPADSMVLLQLLASPLFFEYWRSVGDGFHVTKELIDRFPVSGSLLEACRARASTTEAVWANRADYAREKLNSGRIVRSYDFRNAFDWLKVGVE